MRADFCPESRYKPLAWIWLAVRTQTGRPGDILLKFLFIAWMAIREREWRVESVLGVVSWLILPRVESTEERAHR